MDFYNITIKQIIPQRPPFLMIDRVVSCDGIDAVIDFFVSQDNVLSENNLLSASGIIENMAQSCAALMGCRCLLHGIPITIGYIGEVRNAIIKKRPKCGYTIQTHVHLIEEVFNIIIADVKVVCGDNTIASAYIKVASTNIVANLKD